MQSKLWEVKQEMPEKWMTVRERKKKKVGSTTKAKCKENKCKESKTEQWRRTDSYRSGKQGKDWVGKNMEKVHRAPRKKNKMKGKWEGITKEK